MCHLERPHEVGHLLEADIQRLVGMSGGARRTHDAHAVGLILNRHVIEQLIHGVIGELNNVESARVTPAGGQLRGISLAATPGLPAFTAAADHDPAATICRLVTEELCRVIHGGGLQPVRSVGSAGIALLNVPARRGGSRGARTVANDSLTGCRISLTCANSVSHRSEREGSAGDNRRSCKDCKARNRRSHDTTFRREQKLVA